MPRKRVSDENQQPSTSKRARPTTPPDDQVQHSQALSQAAASQSQSQDEWQRSGKILRIRLNNFMCHENLLIDLNHRVNLLIGRNGSGKSAILTALIVGLGATANKTSRSTNLKSLIRTGESSATIEIEINNRGTDAYDPETYGHKIIIKRKILASGGSNYELKDERGHIVSKKRDELMKMLLYLNIQTDNPVFVLNQDAARTFLRDMDPVKNYIFFQKATQIELILEKLNKCVQMYNDYKVKIGICKRRIVDFENEVRELQERYERLKSVENTKLSISSYKLQRLWLRVSEQESKIRTLKDEMSVKERERDEIEEKVSGNSNNASMQNMLKNLRKEVEEKTRELERENELLSNLRVQYKAENTKYQNEGQQYVKLKDRYKHIKEQIRTIEDEISKRTESSSSRNTRIRQEVKQKVDHLQRRQSDTTAMITTLKQELSINEQNKERQNEEFRTMKLQRVTYDTRITAGQQELSKISSHSSDRMEVYGAHMNGILQAIDRAHQAGKFSTMPKGPLGRYLDVSDRKWRGVVEQLIGNGLLLSFIVNNGKDRLVLDSLIKRNFPEARNTIITAKFRDRVYDVQKGSVPKIPGAHLLLDLIKCTDAVVINCLIDQVRIETILLVENQRLAEQLTSDANNVPPNLQKVVLLDPLIEYFPSPLYRAYSLNPRNPRFIQVNSNERKKAIKDDIQRNQKLKEEIEEKIQSIRRTLGDFEEYQKGKQQLLRKHETTLNEIKMQLEELENTDLPSENEDDILRTELEKLRETLERVTHQMKEKETIATKLKQVAFEKNKAVKKQQEKIETSESELNSLKESLNSKHLEIQTMGNNIRLWNVKLEQLNANIMKLKADCDIEDQQLSEYEEEATKAGNRVNTERSDRELGKMIVRLETEVKEICSTEENIDDVKALLDDRSSKLERDKSFISSLIETLDLLKRSRLQRFKTLKILHEHMAIRVSYTFKQILKIKNFEGELEIDHINKTLKMQIVPRDNHIEKAVSNTKSLSGGERSYTTVALLLSLWSCVDHPFYFLDEYDVFTDQYNREIMTKLLLNEATKKPLRQYTFLSPQDMSFVQASDIIKINKLADPKP